MIVWCPLQGRYASEQECATGCAAPEHRVVCIMESVGDILQHLCPCGGDPSGPQHEESLLHRQWLLGKGLTAPDSLDDEDKRALLDKIVRPDITHRLVTPPPQE